MTSQTKLPFWGKVQKYLDKPWYIVAVAGLAALDLFIMVIPTDGLLITAVLLQKKKWFSRFLWVTTGSSVGALVLALLIQWDVQWIWDLIPTAFESGAWKETETFVQQHGFWALVFFALSIFPQQPAVVVAALAGMSAHEIFFSVWLGRGLKYSVLAYLAAYFPDLITRLWGVRSEVESVRSVTEKEKTID